MCAAISRSEALQPALATRWADGAAEIGVIAADGETRLSHLYQSDPCRVLFPRPPSRGPFEGAIVTTSGGLVGGDRLRFAVSAGANSRACITSQAAEKIYRSTGATTEIDIQVTAESGAVLEWIPQETIAFDGSRLKRKTRIDTAPGSTLLTGEIVVFGRVAHGETFTNGLLHDGWRVFRDGALVWADALHLEEDIATTIAASMMFGGATAGATLLYMADDASDRIAKVRELIETISVDECRMAASCIGPTLIIRFLGPDAAALRQRYSRLWALVRSEILGFPVALPRVWET